MLKILIEKWDKNKELLKNKLKNISLDDIDYKTLVTTTFNIIYNDTDDEYNQLDTKNITEIDNGGYQGTLIYLIPFNTYYQPAEYEYLMTYVGYGSCSGCDTLLSITEYDSGKPTEEQVEELMILCKDILTNTIKPYNDGWREDEKFVQINDDCET